MTDIALRGISERDLDLLLAEEMVASPDFRLWFAHQAGLGDPGELSAVARSVITSTGESDLEFTFSGPKGRARVLVENKLDATLQPHQPERYAARAAGYLHSGECDEVVTVLVAPAAYTGGSAGFDRRITYEAIRAWFHENAPRDQRLSYKLRLVDAALERGSIGWTLVPDDAATDFWDQYWRVARTRAPDLRMPKPGQKPATSGFIRFRPASLGPGVELLHKVPYGHVDLQFAGRADKAAEIDGQYAQLLGSRMYVAIASKSLAVRIDVPRISLEAPFATFEAAVCEGIDAAAALLGWYLRHESTLRGNLTRGWT